MARLLAPELGWDDDETARQAAAYRRSIAHERDQRRRARAGPGRRLRGLSVTVTHPAHRLLRRAGGRRGPWHDGPPIDEVAVAAPAIGLPATPYDRRRPAGPRPAGTGGRWPCTGRWPARSAALAACRVPAGRRRRGGRGARGLPRAPASPSPPPAGAAACAAPACPCTAASCSTSPPWPASTDGRRRRASRSTCSPARSAPTSRPTSAPRGLTLGHWPQSMDISTVGGWLACRGAGPVLDPLREDRGHGRRPRRRARRRPGDHHRRRAADRGRAPTSRRCSSARRARSASSPAARLRVHPLPAGRAPRRVRVRLLGRRRRRVPADPAPGRHPGGAAPLRRGRVAAVARHRRLGRRPARARRGRGPAGRRHDGDRRRGVRRSATRARRRAGRAAGSSTATTSPRSRRSRRRASSSTRWRSPPPGAGCPTIYRQATDGADGRAPRPGRHRPTCRTATATAPACTSPSPPRRHRTRSSRRTSRCGTRARARCSPPGGNLSHHHGVGLNRGPLRRRGAGRRRSSVLAAIKAALDPHGILNPGKLGLPGAGPGSTPWP